jgi:hypothetical protein
MIRDPFYRDIVERLSGRLDPDLFERCASDLLRDEWPTLVPVRGGTDAGMDGAIAKGEGPAFPLVCTTAQDVIGNLTHSLNSYLRDGGSRRQVVLATSQNLTQRRRRNLEKRASEKGFVLVQVYDQAAMADRLYRNPAWCRELLNLTGAPSALSVLPRTKRPLLGEELVGREEDLAWLREANQDCLLTGVPGSGKTFLLYRLALEGWGLFVTTDELTEIAGALRAQQPQVVIVDDAHLNPELVIGLRRLREETGVDFALVATSWRGESDEVIEALNLTEAQIRELPLLTRDEIVEVVENSGVRGPVDLVREIVDQAEGRPGLAVTLAYLCLRGGVREVALGEVLKRSTVTAFERLVGEVTTQVLAAFALGGDAGMRPTVIGRVLELPRYRVHAAVTRLATGGVVDRPRHTYTWSDPESTTEESLVVYPRSLRYALVRDVFFGGLPALPSGELIEAAPNVAEVARTLVRATAYGAQTPPALLTGLLEQAGVTDAWEEYAALGKTEATYVLTNHPEMTVAIANTALAQAPIATIPRLLMLAVGDNRPTNSFPDHPLRQIEERIQVAMPGTNQAVQRRTLLVESAAVWISEGLDESVGIRALRMAMSPAFNNYTIDPGAGMMVTFRQGLLLPGELSSLKELWPLVVRIVEAVDNVPWRYLLEVIHDWAYPSLHIPQGKASEEMVTDMRAFAERMLADLVRVSKGHPAFRHEATEYVQELGWDLDVTPDREFEILFPLESYKDLRAPQERQSSPVRELAVEWSGRNPADVVKRIVELEAAAKDVDHRHPRHTPMLCEEIATRTDRPMEWLQALLDNHAAPDLIVPFLSGAASGGEKGWEERARECLANPALTFATISVVLTSPDPPPQLLSEVLQRLEGYGDFIKRRCLKGEVPENTLASLLRHENPKVAVAAATGEWYSEPQGTVREGLNHDWRVAVLRAAANEYWLHGILESDPQLAHDWLRSRMEEASIAGMYMEQPAVQAAVSSLSREQRLSILRTVRPQSMYTSVVSALVGSDLELYERFLKDEKTHVQRWPLVGRPMGNWPEKAKLALSAGFSAEEVAGAAFGGEGGWVGLESDMWGTWIEQFTNLLSHEDEGIRRAADYGIQHAKRQRQRALEEERHEAIYGG